MFVSVSQSVVNRSGQFLVSLCRTSGLMQWQQQRNVVKVRRLFPPPIPGLGKPPRLVNKKSAKVYILEEDTTHRPREKLKLILTQDLPKIGNQGEVVMIDKRVGRAKLREGAAVYASPENLKEFALAKKKEMESSEANAASRLSPMAVKTIAHLKQSRLEVRMQEGMEWDVITKDHVIHAFRHRLGVVVAEHALTLPAEPITECGTYSVDVTVNGIETVPVEIEVIRYQPKRRSGRSSSADSLEDEDS